MVVADEVKEVSGLQQFLLESGEDQGGIALRNLGHQNANRMRTPAAQRSCQQVGPVVQLPRGLQDPLLGRLWN